MSPETLGRVHVSAQRGTGRIEQASLGILVSRAFMQDVGIFKDLFGGV